MVVRVSPSVQSVPQPSSTVPSQSSSTLPSHTSVVAPANGSQVSPPHTPAVQVSTPVLPVQAPTPQVVGCVIPSTVPSQSLSRSSQISSAGSPGTALHSDVNPSAEQTTVPSEAHSPIPFVQGFPRSGKSSSTDPSPSLSIPSQISGSRQSGSAGKSVRPSQSLSSPSKHELLPGGPSVPGSNGDTLHSVPVPSAVHTY